VDEQLAWTKGEVSRLSGKLGLYGRMGGQPAVVPQWEPSAAAVAAAAPPAAPPVVEVAASGAGQAPLSMFDNPALAGLKSSVDTAFDNKMYGSYVSRPIPASQR
jgi:hypothetical protein